MPPSTTAHGVSFFGVDNALVANFSIDHSRVHVIQISTNSLLHTIETPGYNGTGSITVSPLLTHALASGSRNTLMVIQAPFTAASVISTVTLPDEIKSYQTEAIVFDRKGRAFVYNKAGISVLDAPYISIEFTIPVDNLGGAIAITPDGNTLLVTNMREFNRTVRIFNAPFSADSLATTLTVAGSTRLNGIVISPDGNTALVVDSVTNANYNYSTIFAIQAPFTANSVVQSIPLPEDIGTFEDIDIDATSQLAIVTGGDVLADEMLPVLFIQAPFTTDEATTFAVTIPNGRRGAGAARFLPAALSATASLNITKTGPATITQGDSITYTLTYGNTGQADAVNTVIQDSLPANTSFISASHNGTLNGNEVVWNVGTAVAGVSNQTVQFTVQANAAPGSNITNNTYSIAADGVYAVVGVVPVVTTLSATASLNITKTGPLTVDPNGQITYTLTYGNTGQADATNTVIQDTLPANTSFVSSSHNGTLNGNEVVWNVGTAVAGVSNQTVQFTVQANAAPGSEITNQTYSIAADGVAAVAGSVPVTTTVNQAQAVQPVPTLNQGMILLCMILLFGIAALRLRQI